MKPALGLLRNYQIICVELNAKNGKKCYTEQWCLQINGLQERQKLISLFGATSEPLVLLNQNNIVDFGIVQQNSEKILNVPLQNTSLLK